MTKKTITNVVLDFTPLDFHRARLSQTDVILPRTFFSDPESTGVKLLRGTCSKELTAALYAAGLDVLRFDIVSVGPEITRPNVEAISPSVALCGEAYMPRLALSTGSALRLHGKVLSIEFHFECELSEPKAKPADHPVGYYYYAKQSVDTSTAVLVDAKITIV